MMHVYVIRSLKDGRLYAGISSDISKRIRAHNSGKVKSTKGFRPWKLLHSEVYPDRQSARKREKYLKSGYGKQWLKQKFAKVH